jgi:deazaflavin-dependent oxidoreductase (nitroreductase family)
MSEFDDPVDARQGDWVGEHLRRYVASGGTDGHRMFGMPTLLLTTIGRKSAAPRRTPLTYGRDGESLIVVASFAGAPEHPQWYRNLAAHPRGRVQLKDELFDVQAHDAVGDERTRLWRLMADQWPAYHEYQAKTERVIPVVVLDRL